MKDFLKLFGHAVLWGGFIFACGYALFRMAAHQ